MEASVVGCPPIVAMTTTERLTMVLLMLAIVCLTLAAHVGPMEASTPRLLVVHGLVYLMIIPVTFMIISITSGEVVLLIAPAATSGTCRLTVVVAVASTETPRLRIAAPSEATGLLALVASVANHWFNIGVHIPVVFWCRVPARSSVEGLSFQSIAWHPLKKKTRKQTHAALVRNLFTNG
jgi:hypothetical protein